MRFVARLNGGDLMSGDDVVGTWRRDADGFYVATGRHGATRHATPGDAARHLERRLVESAERVEVTASTATGPVPSALSPPG